MVAIMIQSFRFTNFRSFIEKRLENPIVIIAIGTIKDAFETVKFWSYILK